MKSCGAVCDKKEEGIAALKIFLNFLKQREAGWR
jgi:hypothetical protein